MAHFFEWIGLAIGALTCVGGGLWETNEMKLLNLILNIYERWLDRWRFGKLEPLDHYCVRRILENGDEIKYMMRYDPRTTKRGQPPTETSE